MWSFVWLIVGFAALVWGADHFVRGASTLAKKLGVPSLIIGLTVVALGTSAPELAVSVTAGLNQSNEIAIGNVIGSNLFNLLVVAGGSALICPLVVDRDLLRRDWHLTILATAILGGLAMWGRVLTRFNGLIMLAVFLFILYLQISAALKSKKLAEPDPELENPPKYHKPLWIAFDILVGLTFIVLGGEWSVDGASGIARMFGLTETVIGLTVVAIGTSLPELVTSLAAARRGENDIAMGNVIGSCLFNVLFILGVSCAITPIPVLETGLMDFGILLVVTALLYIPAKMGKFGRTVGAVSILSYAGYMTWVVMR